MVSFTRLLSFLCNTSLHLRGLGVNLRQTHILAGWLRGWWPRVGHVRWIVTGIVCRIRQLWCVRCSWHHTHSSTGWPELLRLVWRLRQKTTSINGTALRTIALRAGRVHWGRRVTFHGTRKGLHLLSVVHGHLTASHLPLRGSSTCARIKVLSGEYPMHN